LLKLKADTDIADDTAEEEAAGEEEALWALFSTSGVRARTSCACFRALTVSPV
jgi:hypothetical protein